MESKNMLDQDKLNISEKIGEVISGAVSSSIELKLQTDSEEVIVKKLELAFQQWLKERSMISFV
jgi:hypothetical protein